MMSSYDESKHSNYYNSLIKEVHRVYDYNLARSGTTMSSPYKTHTPIFNQMSESQSIQIDHTHARGQLRRMQDVQRELEDIDFKASNKTWNKYETPLPPQKSSLMVYEPKYNTMQDYEGDDSDSNFQDIIPPVAPRVEPSMNKIESISPKTCPPMADDPQMFAADRFIFLLAQCLEDAEQEQMKISNYTDLYYESLKLFRHFGKAVALGFKGKSVFLIHIFHTNC